MGDPERAEPLFAESVDLRRQLGDDQASLAVVLLNLAIVALDRHDLTRARTIGEECLAMAEDADQWVHAVSLLLLADVAVEEGELPSAAKLLRDALPVLRQLGGVSAHRVPGLVCWARSRPREGRDRRPAHRCRRRCAERDRGDDRPSGRAHARGPRLAAARGSLGEDKFESVRRNGRTLTLEQALDLALIEVVPESAG